MKIVNQWPPNILEIRKVFKIIKDTVFTYGDTIYAPGIAFELPQHLIVHEQTHSERQGITPGLWWEKYLQDTRFRFEQELEAYRAQYQYFKSNTGRQQYRKFARTLAKDLSSPMYGNIVDFTMALEMIK
jgi:hypothetical protein